MSRIRAQNNESQSKQATTPNPDKRKGTHATPSAPAKKKYDVKNRKDLPKNSQTTDNPLKRRLEVDAHKKAQKEARKKTKTAATKKPRQPKKPKQPKKKNTQPKQPKPVSTPSSTLGGAANLSKEAIMEQ